MDTRSSQRKVNTIEDPLAVAEPCLPGGGLAPGADLGILTLQQLEAVFHHRPEGELGAACTVPHARAGGTTMTKRGAEIPANCKEA